MTLDTILQEVTRYTCSLVTVTGGELLALSNCLSLKRLLCSESFEVDLKTSAALFFAQVDRRVSIVLDLKTAGSGESHRNERNNPSEFSGGMRSNL